MSSIINNNKDLNTFFTSSKDKIILETYLKDIIPSTSTILEDTIIIYNNSIKVLFCINCSINLTKVNYINHLKKRHSILYNKYKNNNILDYLINKVNSLEFYKLEEIKAKLGFNKYYFRELPILFNNYKYLEYLYININRKLVRIYYNNTHFNNNSKSTTKEVEYIKYNIPL